MDKNTEKVFEYLKGKNKLSGGAVREALNLSKTEWDKAKAELKDAGLVELGRGRGGTIRLISEDKPPETKKRTKAESMAIAREEKAALSNEQKRLNKIREHAWEIIKRELPGWEKEKIWLDQVLSETSCIAYLRIEDEGGYWQPYKVNLI